MMVDFKLTKFINAKVKTFMVERGLDPKDQKTKEALTLFAYRIAHNYNNGAHEQDTTTV